LKIPKFLQKKKMLKEKMFNLQIEPYWKRILLLENNIVLIKLFVLYLLFNILKRIILNNNFYYKIYAKSESVNLYHNNNRITLFSYNLNQLKLLETCKNANIIELTNKLVMYKTNVFKNACIFIKHVIL